MGRTLRGVFSGVCLVMVAGCATTDDRPSPLGQVPELRPGVLAGYLPRERLPDSLALLPPPPAAGSPELAADEAVRQAATERPDGDRFAQARDDANLAFPQAAQAFACALGVPIDERASPYLYTLLRRSLVDAGLSTYRAKDHYRRQRPFVVHRQAMCTPHEEAFLTKDGSYPSGHSAVGWAWALILTELAPDRADAILARGLSYGRSRSVCNVHWASDIRAGRTVGAAAVARLHADPTFRADLRRAGAELAALRAAGARPTADCAAQARVLGKP